MFTFEEEADVLRAALHGLATLLATRRLYCLNYFGDEAAELGEAAGRAFAVLAATQVSKSSDPRITPTVEKTYSVKVLDTERLAITDEDTDVTSLVAVDAPRTIPTVQFIYGIADCSACKRWHPALLEEPADAAPRIGGLECHCGEPASCSFKRLGKRATEAEARGALLAWLEENS